MSTRASYQGEATPPSTRIEWTETHCPGGAKAGQSENERCFGTDRPGLWREGKDDSREDSVSEPGAGSHLRMKVTFMFTRYSVILPSSTTTVCS